MIIFLVVMFLAVGGAVYLGVSQTQFSTPTIVQQASSCGISTTLTVNAVNALAEGTSVSPTYTAKINGGAAESFTSGTTTLSPGDSVQILASAPNFINTVVTTKQIHCGSNRIDVPIYATGTVSGIDIYNTNNNIMTDSAVGGAVNQSALTAGEALTITTKFRGTNQQSTGDLIYVIEAGSAANITSIDMVGAKKLSSVPSVYTTKVAGSKVVAFEVPAIVGASTISHDITFTTGTGKLLSGAVYTTYYSEQEATNTDGTFFKGVQDANGNAVYEDSGTSDCYIN